MDETSESNSSRRPRLPVNVRAQFKPRNLAASSLFNGKAALGGGALSCHPLLDSLRSHTDLLGKLCLSTHQAAGFFD